MTSRNPPPNAHGAATPENIERAHKARQILELRTMGWTLTQIGDHVGLSPASVSKHIRRAIEQIPMEEAHHLVALELDRLDRMQLEADTLMADSKNPYVKLKAMEILIRVMERRARYLPLEDTERRQLEAMRASLTAEQGALVAAVMNRVAGRLNLTPEQRDAFPRLAAEEIRRVAADTAQAAIQGELVDDGEAGGS
ncbi:hypothetical protein [Sinomonas cyclohexanicum]|uniref:hypothetical protein n=1 Tax=Sinomonas cyclohexanicum TaxID=322009 RepID=UPI001E33DA69|nr:hypothetical protein [Corynebacterium cyclohexanicum]